MHKLLKSLLALYFVSLFLSTAVANEIYKTRDKDGNIVYTDSPLGKKAEKVDLPEINRQPPTKHMRIRADKPAKAKPTNYAVQLLTPNHETTLTPGQRDLLVTASVSPGLKRGHYAVLMLDGSPYLEPSRTPSFMIENIYRGEHTVQVSIMDSTGKTIASSPSHTVYVIRPRAGG